MSLHGLVVDASIRAKRMQDEAIEGIFRRAMKSDAGHAFRQEIHTGTDIILERVDCYSGDRLLGSVGWERDGYSFRLVVRLESDDA